MGLPGDPSLGNTTTSLGECQSPLEFAIAYLRRGWSVFPGKWQPGVAKKKLRATVPWQQFQGRSPTEDEIRKWCKKWPDTGIFVVTGHISNLVVLDIDDRRLLDIWGLHGPTVATGKGYHLYFKHPGTPLHNQVRIQGQPVDIRGDGGCAAAPPTLHPNGSRYRWLATPDGPLPEIPTWLLDVLAETKPTPLPETIPEGQRNAGLTSLAGSMRRRGASAKAIEAALLVENAKCAPPLSPAEVRQIAASVARYAPEARPSDRKGAPQAEELAKLADDTFLFHSPNYQTYAQIGVDGHLEVWPCRSKTFKRWLGAQFYSKRGKVPNSEALASTLNVLEGRATFTPSAQHEVHNRVAVCGDAIYYDLADDQWRVVKIDRKGWTVSPHSPVFFRRYPHQLAQCEPTPGDPGETLARFLRLVNVVGEENQLLLTVTLVAALVPDIPHPVLMPYGTQGCGKSWLSYTVKQLLDPTTLPKMGLPTNLGDMILALDGNYTCSFDNVSGLAPWQSDALCRASTGEGFLKRELYSDGDVVTFAFRRSVVINGINLIAESSDLLDRTIPLLLPPLAERRSEDILERFFAQARPEIVGAMFTILSGAMSLRDQVSTEGLPRMADFALWGRAITSALGREPALFDEAYARNIETRQGSVLEASVVASTLVRFMADQSQWAGTASELLAALTRTAQDCGIDVSRLREWPRVPNVLSRQLNLLQPNFAAAGIRLDRGSGREKKTIFLTMQGG